MICRNIYSREPIEVNELNTLRIGIDRSETAFTETALNAWRPGLIGPPHFHEHKEQVFFIVSGEGTIRMGDQSYDVQPHALVYCPASVEHQTIVSGERALEYLLYNIFTDPRKEGCATFKEHIRKVKDIRSAQARQQNAGRINLRVKPAHEPKWIPDIRKGKIRDSELYTTRQVLDRADTEKCEARVVNWLPNSNGPPIARDDIEQVWYVLSGSGIVTVSDESNRVASGDVVYVPCHATYGITVGPEGLSYLCLNTLVSEACG